jgi:peptidyl-prolyl cis-trans isomerase D
MLAEMRQLTRSWLARGLLVLISLALAVTLIPADITAGLQSILFPPNAVAVVGGRTVSTQELDRDLRTFLKNQSSSGQPMSQADAIEQNVPARLLNGIIQRRALNFFADRLGVQTSDEVVGQAIRAVPLFQEPGTGAFNDERYQRFLQEIGMTHAGFVEDMRADLSSQQILQALTQGVRAPGSFGELLLALQSETRVASIAQIPAARAGDIGEPTNAQVQSLYAELAPRLQVPSYRAVTVVLARLDSFVERAQIPETRIREAFEAARERLSQPERRSFIQITAQTSAQANQAAQRLARGESPAAVAQAMNLQMIAFDLKPQSEIPDPAVARAVFAMRQGAAPQAVRGSLAPWAAVRLDETAAGVEAKFEDHRDEIKSQLARQEAQGLREEAITAFSEALEEGTPIAQAASAHGLEVTVVPAVDEQGRMPDGAAAEAFIDEPDLVQAAFETEQGETTDFMQTEGGAEALIQVDSITPARTRPLAQVRDQVVDLWKAQERHRRLEAIGERVVRAINSGRSFTDAVSAEGGSILAKSEVVDRPTAARSLAEIFSAREGEAVMGVNPAASVLLVAQVEEIRRANPAEQRAVVEQLRQGVERGEGGLTSSLGEAVLASARDAANVRQNPRLLERTYPRAKGADAQGQ